MKIISFNVNGIRARIHQLAFIIEKYKPDIIGLQETKVADESFPIDELTKLGYQVAYHGQKQSYGVALLSQVKPEHVIKGFPHDDCNAQRRLIMGDFKLSSGQILRVINGYFPQGESRDHPTKFQDKRKFYTDLQFFIENQCSHSQLLAIIGDFNISSSDKDIGIGADNAKRWLSSGKCSFLPEERTWFSSLLSWGLVDCYRHFESENESNYSWFDYRSRGFEKTPKRGLRIDGVLATQSLFSTCSSAIIDYEARAMDRPSDHAPVVVTFAIQ